jgi:hypothetical protein
MLPLVTVRRTISLSASSLNPRELTCWPASVPFTGCMELSIVAILSLASGVDGQAARPSSVPAAIGGDGRNLPLQGLLAHAYAATGQREKAEALFRQVTARSTSSETYLNFAGMLASTGRNAEAREWAQKVLDKKPWMPAYLRRRERPWFRRAHEMMK